MTNFVVSRTIWFSITYIQKKIKGLTKQTISLTYILWYFPLTVKSKTVKQNSMFIATTSVINANSKTITMMKVFGYSSRECAKAVLNGYRLWAYLGFVLGTIYQYALLKIMVSVVFKDVENVPDYQFDFPVMLITLAAFLILYEAIMFAYTKRMKKLSVKEIMLD